MSNFRDVLRVQGVKAKGFGIVPKLVMLDRKLTVEAKAIYSYFCSYAGAGDTAFPGRDKICDDLCIGKDRYYKHRELLIKYGYIEIEQIRSEKNKYSHNIYTLVDKPIENTDVEPSHENKDTGTKPCHENKDTDTEDTLTKDNNNNNLYNNNKSLYNQSFIQEKQEEKKNERMNENNINELQNIYNKSEVEYVEEKVAVKQAIKVLYYSDKPLKVNGMSVPLNQVREDLKQLEYKHIVQAINDYHEGARASKITNHIAYLGTCIYNAIFSIDMKVQAELLNAGII